MTDIPTCPARQLSRYDDVRVALSHRDLAPHIAGLPDSSAMDDSGMLFLMHGAPHARLRRLVAGAFSARRIAMLRPAVEQLAATLAASLRAGGPTVDLVGAYAAPLAIGSLSELLAVPVADRPGFAAWSDGMAAITGSTTIDDAARAGEQVRGFVADLVQTRRRTTGNDFISTLFEVRDADGTALTETEVSAVTFSMLVAGYFPTAQALATGVVRLLAYPQVAAEVRAAPGRIVPVVEELLRLDPFGRGPADRTLRAVADLDIGGLPIRAGEIVNAPLGTANRDPDQFPDPDRLDPDRQANPHLSFAAGAHHCLGAALARMQLQIGIETLLRTLPGLALAVPFDELAWHVELGGQESLTALPVTW